MIKWLNNDLIYDLANLPILTLWLTELITELIVCSLGKMEF